MENKPSASKKAAETTATATLSARDQELMLFALQSIKDGGPPELNVGAFQQKTGHASLGAARVAWFRLKEKIYGKASLTLTKASGSAGGTSDSPQNLQTPLTPKEPKTPKSARTTKSGSKVEGDIYQNAASKTQSSPKKTKVQASTLNDDVVLASAPSAGAFEGSAENPILCSASSAQGIETHGEPESSGTTSPVLKVEDHYGDALMSDAAERAALAASAEMQPTELMPTGVISPATPTTPSTPKEAALIKPKIKSLPLAAANGQDADAPGTPTNPGSAVSDPSDVGCKIPISANKKRGRQSQVQKAETEGQAESENPAEKHVPKRAKQTHVSTAHEGGPVEMEADERDDMHVDEKSTTPKKPRKPRMSKAKKDEATVAAATSAVGTSTGSHDGDDSTEEVVSQESPLKVKRTRKPTTTPQAQIDEEAAELKAKGHARDEKTVEEEQARI